MKKTREELEKGRDNAIAKREQYLHQAQRLENRFRDQQEAERKKRNHRLIVRGADIESVAPELRGMSQSAFRMLVEKIFSLPEVAALVCRAIDQQGGG
ncbi:MAG: DUF3847 domain-containing protein [Oscillospiraceae bacterium]|jgi:hypothetical protein|nr:DUF3847 domain-containing protein [Oscillospiraceae bacterium]